MIEHSIYPTAEARSLSSKAHVLVLERRSNVCDPAGNSVDCVADWQPPGPVRLRGPYKRPLTTWAVSSLCVPVPDHRALKPAVCGFYIIVCPISSDQSLAVQPPLLADIFRELIYPLSPPSTPQAVSSHLKLWDIRLFASRIGTLVVRGNTFPPFLRCVNKFVELDLGGLP